MSEYNYCEINSNGLCFTDVVCENSREYYTIEKSDEYTECGTTFRFYYDVYFSNIKTFVICPGTLDLSKFEGKIEKDRDIDFFELIQPVPSVNNFYGPAVIEYDKSGKIREERWWHNDSEYTKNVNEWIQNNKLKTWKDMKEEDFNRMWMEVL